MGKTNVDRHLERKLKDPLFRELYELEMQKAALRETQQKFEAAQERSEGLHQEFRTFQQRVHESERARTQMAEVARFRRWFVYPALPVICFSAVVVALMTPLSDIVGFWDSTAAIASILAVAWIFVLQRLGTQNAAVSKTTLFKRVSQLWKWILALPSAVLTKILIEKIIGSLR